MSESILTYLSYAYLTVGMVFTLYTIIFYFFTGIPLFKEADPERTPFRHKASYVFVTFFMLPVFYIVFLKEIIGLKKIRKESRS